MLIKHTGKGSDVLHGISYNKQDIDSVLNYIKDPVSFMMSYKQLIYLFSPEIVILTYKETKVTLNVIFHFR